MRLFNDYFRGKKILVTGHTGFKGAWLSLWLHELGAEVTGYALKPPTQPNFYEQTGLSKCIRSLRGDVRDLEDLRKALNDTSPEIVFHLAAQSLVRTSYDEPLETVSTNILGTTNILEAVRQNGSVKVCQIITSDKCYENDGSGKYYQEEDKMGGNDLYSASKGAAELMVTAFRHSFFESSKTSLSSVRAGNVIGGGDWSLDRLVPDCIRALQKSQSIVVRNPNSIRPWQYVLDALSGYLLLAQHQAEAPSDYASAWNFGPCSTETLKVSQLAQSVIKVWGTGTWIGPESRKNHSEPYEAKLLQLDSRKARTNLNWQPVFSTAEAVRDSVLWYKETQNLPQEKIYDFSVKQLHNYSKSAQDKGWVWTQPDKVLR